MLGAVPQLARAARAKDEARVMEGYLKVQYSAVGRGRVVQSGFSTCKYY